MAFNSSPVHGKWGLLYRYRKNGFKASASSTGLNDVTWGRSYIGANKGDFEVEIDANGTADTFKWRHDGGAYTEDVTITGSAQELENGQTITFAATTGHTIGDVWHIGNFMGEPTTESTNTAQITEATHRLLKPGADLTWQDLPTLAVTGSLVGAATNLMNGNGDIQVRGNYAYIAAFVAGLIIVDISDPTSPSVESSISGATNLLAGATGVALKGNYAYVAAQTSLALAVIDISDPSNPTLAGSISGATELLEGASAVAISGDYAYVAAKDSNALVEIDISDPTSPSASGSISGATNELAGAFAVAISGNYAYVSAKDSSMFTSIDISTPGSPAFADSIACGGARHAALKGEYAYVCQYDNDKLLIVDISDPTSLSSPGSLTGATNYLDGIIRIDVSGTYAYLVSYNSDALAVIDISDPTSPTLVTQLEGATNYLDEARGITVVGDYAYIVSNASESLVIVNVNDKEIETVENTIGKATFSGNVGTVTVSGEDAYVLETCLEEVGYMQGWSLSYSKEATDVSRSGQDWKEFKAGKSTATGSVDRIFIGNESFMEDILSFNEGQEYFLLQLFTNDPDNDQTGDHVFIWAQYSTLGITANDTDVVRENLSFILEGIPSDFVAAS